MGVFAFVGRVVRNVSGYDAVAAGAAVVRSSSRRSLQPVCPKCAEGRLMKANYQEEGGAPEKWLACDQCDYVQPQGGAGEEQINELKDYADQRMNELTGEQLDDLAAGHRRSSRMFYASSLLVLIYAIYSVFSTDKALVILASGSMGSLLFILGLKSAYRCWQVETKTLFKAGAFKQWLAQGQWVV